jgi:hypothetical protein
MVASAIPNTKRFTVKSSPPLSGRWFAKRS